MATRNAKRSKGTKPETYARTQIGVLSGDRAPRSYAKGDGISAYFSWVAAAASINAYGVAAVPLRLYAQDRGSRAKALWPVRKIGRAKAAYLAGDGKRTPGRATLRKMASLGNMVEVTDHPALALLHDVNPWSSGFELSVLRQMHLQLTGNAYLFAVEGPDGPLELWPLPPDRMWVIPDAGRWISGYLFRGPQGGEIRFSADEVMHFKLPNPQGGFYGMGNVERGWQAVRENVAEHEMDLAMYENNARPDYAWIIKNTGADQKQIDAFVARMNSQVKGRRNRGKSIAITGEVDLKPLNFAPKDLTGREDIVEEIAAVFGVPVSMLKANDPNLASATAGYAAWREMTIAPLCRMDEDALNAYLLPLYGLEGEAVFAYDDPVPGNEQLEADIRVKYVAGGILTPNEGRLEIGYDPHDAEASDELLVNGNPIGAAAVPVSPFDTIPAQVEEKPAPKTNNDAVSTAADPNATVQDTALNGAQVTALVELAVQARQGGIPVATAQAIAGAAFPLVTPEQLSAIFTPIDAAPPLPQPEPQPAEQAPPPPPPAAATKSACCNHSLEKVVRQSEQYMKIAKQDRPTATQTEEDRVVARFVDRLAATLGSQADAVRNALSMQGLSDRDLVEVATRALTDPKWFARIMADARPLIEYAVGIGGAAGDAALASVLPPGQEFQMANPEVQRYVDTATARLAQGITETTTVRVRDLLGTGLNDGETVRELADRVSSAVTGIDESRATTIARTESARAYGQGQVEAWKQSGVVVGKRWLLAPDPCPFCEAAAAAFAASAVPLDQPFYPLGSSVTGSDGSVMRIDYAAVDGPPLHPNCRCSMLAEVQQP